MIFDHTLEFCPFHKGFIVLSLCNIRQKRPVIEKIGCPIDRTNACRSTEHVKDLLGPEIPKLMSDFNPLNFQ